MTEVDYIIVGDGFAALFLAHQCIKNGKKFLIYSDGKKGASQVSAGMVNPVVLKRFTPIWMAEDQIEFLKTTLSEIENYTLSNYWNPNSIYRIFHNEDEKNLWTKKSQKEELKEFLSTEFETTDKVENPFGIGKVKYSGRLEVEAFFTGMITYLKQNGYFIDERFEYMEFTPESNTYKNVNFRNIIFAEGINVLNNPWFNYLPVTSNKGQQLTVRLENDLGDCVYKKKHFLFKQSAGQYYYGGTYSRDNINEGIDDEQTEILKNSCKEILTKFEVIKANYGYRPTVADRKPIIGQHPEFKNLFVFNGLGTRGVLLGCFFSEKLYKHIEENDEVMPEVSIKRFDHLYGK